MPGRHSWLRNALWDGSLLFGPMKGDISNIHGEIMRASSKPIDLDRGIPLQDSL